VIASDSATARASSAPVADPNRGGRKSLAVAAFTFGDNAGDIRQAAATPIVVPGAFPPLAPASAPASSAPGNNAKPRHYRQASINEAEIPMRLIDKPTYVREALKKWFWRYGVF
jgi:hypothetical protein